jgi:hypothetical protein
MVDVAEVVGAARGVEDQGTTIVREGVRDVVLILLIELVLVGFILATLALSLGYWVYIRGGTEVQAQGQTGDCPSPQLIDEFSGNGNRNTDTFDTTTNQFRISYETTSTSEIEGILVINVISADDPNQGSIESTPQDGSGTGESFVNAPPGSYYLDITAGEVDYNITVEQCGSGDPPSTNPNTGSTTPQKAQPSPSPAPKTPATPPKTPSPALKTPSPAPKTPPSPSPNDSGTLMNAGGPTTGPVPMMLNGSCPRELNNLRDGACYST